MKTSELLRNLADLIASTEQGGDGAPQTAQDLMSPVEPESNSQEPELTTMVPPLQQKLEILKKSAGMDNAFDNQESDELDDIKKLTGIKAVVQHVAGEDNDITG
jgi:uncharacterized protein YfkK (UPF0435 family)